MIRIETGIHSVFKLDNFLKLYSEFFEVLDLSRSMYNGTRPTNSTIEFKF